MLGALHMAWRHVCFANWPVDPGAVEPHIPETLSLDTYEGDAWLSVVPFTNVDVRPTWLPSGTGFALPELNLRTYVTYGNDPGVYFFSLDADGLWGVLGARIFHHLPYFNADIDLSVVGERIEFESRRHHRGARPAVFDGTYRPSGDALATDPGSLAHFLTERYRYYTEAPDGSIRYATVEHEPWTLYDATLEIRENTLFRANGFAEPATEPVYVYSPGVETVASGSRRT